MHKQNLKLNFEFSLIEWHWVLLNIEETILAYGGGQADITIFIIWKISYGVELET